MAEKPETKKAAKKKEGEVLTDPRAIARREAEKDIKALGVAPENPDNDAYNNARQDLTNELDAIRARLEVIGETIQNKIGGNDSQNSKKQGLFEERKVISDEIQEIMNSKDSIKKEKDALYNRNESTSKEFQNMKKEVTVESLDALEKRIEEIKKKMHLSSLSLSEEKKCIAEIAQLKKMKPKFELMAQKKKEIEDLKGKKQEGIQELKKQNESLQEKLSGLFDRRKKIDEDINVLKEEENKKRSSLDKEFKERDALRAKRDELQEKRKKLQETHRAAVEKHREHQNKVWAIIKEKEKEQWAIVEAKQKQEALAIKKEKAKENPFLGIMTLLEQTIAYLKTLAPRDGGAKTEEEKKAEKDLSADAPKGMAVLKSKKERDEEFYWAPTKSKKDKKKAASKSKPQTIKHNAGTFEMFQELNCDAPISTTDVAPTLEKLETQLAEFHVKVTEWQQKQEEEIAKEAENGGGAAEEETKEE